MSNAASRDGSASKNGSYCCASPYVVVVVLLAGCGPLVGERPFLALGSEALYLPGAAEGLVAEAELSLYNLGGGELRIAQLRLEPSGMTAGSWSLDRSGPVVLEPDAALTLKVRHRPALGALARARLVLASNDPDRPEITVQLTAPGSGANLSATPGRVDFGAVGTGKTSTRAVRIVNLGRAAARALELVWSGQSADGDFSAALPAGALPPAGTLDLQLSYTPRGGGSDAARLQLRWHGSSGVGRSLELQLTGVQDLKAPD